MFEWISGARNKAADCLSQLVELPEKHQKNPNGTKPTQINMVRAVTTRSGTRKTSTDNETKNRNLWNQTQTMTPQATTVQIIARTP